MVVFKKNYFEIISSLQNLKISANASTTSSIQIYQLTISPICLLSAFLNYFGGSYRHHQAHLTLTFWHEHFTSKGILFGNHITIIKTKKMDGLHEALGSIPSTSTKKQQKTNKQTNKQNGWTR
jgi:hypothetical protein